MVLNLVYKTGEKHSYFLFSAMSNAELWDLDTSGGIMEVSKLALYVGFDIFRPFTI